MISCLALSEILVFKRAISKVACLTLLGETSSGRIGFLSFPESIPIVLA